MSPHAPGPGAGEEAWIRAAVDHVEAAVAILDTNGRVLYVNPADERLTGRPAADLIGRDMATLLPPDLAGQVPSLMEQLLREGRLRRDVVSVRADGSRALGHIAAEVVRDVAGEPRWIITEVQDLSTFTGQLELLSSTALSIVADPEADVLVAIVRAARVLTGARYAALGLIGEDGRLDRFITDGLGEPEIRAIGSWPQGLGLLGAMIAERRTINVPDIRSDPRSAGFPPGHPVMTSFLGVPIRAGELFLGHLYLTDKKDAPSFSVVDERLAELFASHAAVAIRDRQQRGELEAALSALRASEERFRLLAENSHDMIYRLRLDPERVFEYVSPAASAITGHEPAEFYADPQLDRRLIHPEDRRSVELLHQAHPPIEESLDVRRTRRDGTPVWTEERAVPIWEEGRIVAVEGVIRDVTARRLAEEERRFQARAFRNVRDGVVVTGPDGRILYWNKGASVTFGYSAARMIGRTLDVLFPDTAPEALARHLDRVHTEGDASEDLEGRHKNGSVVSVSLRTTLLKDARRRPIGFIVISHDIGARKRAERERVRLAAAVEQTGDAVILTDPSGAIVYVNAAFERLTGYAREEAVGRSVGFLSTGSDPAASVDAIARTLAARTIWTGQRIERRKDGSPIQTDSVISAIVGEDGRPGGWLEVARDVTRERELESQLRQAQKMEAIGRLAGGIAHDFNNLLTAVFGHVQILLAETPPGAPHRDDLAAIELVAERATALTAQLLAFSRRQALRPRVLELNAVVRGLAPLLRRLLGAGIALELDLASTAGRVRADLGQLEQVVINLALNARDAMPSGGTLTIATADAGPDAWPDVEPEPGPAISATPGGESPGVILEVRDTGLGMDAETLGHVFEPFFTTKGPGQGTGLGLATVYGIVSQSNGRIDALSEPGQGTTFRVHLPRVAEPPDEPAPEEHREPVPRGSETVLLVEDDEQVRVAAARALEQQGYRVLAAGSAEEAIGLVEGAAGEVALAVVDVLLRGVSGRDLAHRLRSATPGLRVVFVSGYAEDVAAPAQVPEAGTAFLQKPYTPSGLARKVRDVLDATIAT